MAEWSIAAVLKTVEGHTSGGSNPSFSALKNQVWLHLVIGLILIRTIGRVSFCFPLYDFINFQLIINWKQVFINWQLTTKIPISTGFQTWPLWFGPNLKVTLRINFLLVTSFGHYHPVFTLLNKCFKVPRLKTQFMSPLFVSKNLWNHNLLKSFEPQTQKLTLRCH